MVEAAAATAAAAGEGQVEAEGPCLAAEKVQVPGQGSAVAEEGPLAMSVDAPAHGLPLASAAAADTKAVPTAAASCAGGSLAAAASAHTPVGVATPAAAADPAAVAEGGGDAAEAPAAAAAAAAAEAPAGEPLDVTTYENYYAERWGQASLAPDQPLLLATRVSRQQLARGLELRRSRKRSFGLHLEAEGGCGV